MVRYPVYAYLTPQGCVGEIPRALYEKARMRAARESFGLIQNRQHMLILMADPVHGCPVAQQGAKTFGIEGYAMQMFYGVVTEYPCSVRYPSGLEVEFAEDGKATLKPAPMRKKAVGMAM